MKTKPSSLVAASLSLFLAAATQHSIADTEEEKLVAEEVKKMFTVSPAITKLKSPALEAIMTAKVYDVDVTIKGPGSSSSSRMRLLKSDDGTQILRRPNTNQKCPELKKAIKKDFKLATEKDAKTLEAALDLLYPISGHFDGRDLKAKAIRKEDGKVIFVRGTFFKKLKAFIFAIDEDGTIKEVSYTLQLERQ